jgi:nuclear pore complex protein Nup85
MDYPNIMNAGDDERGGRHQNGFQIGNNSPTFGAPTKTTQQDIPPPPTSSLSNIFSNTDKSVDQRLKEEVNFSFEQSSRTNEGPQDNDAEEVVDESSTFHLEGAPIPSGGVETWSESNRTLFFKTNPVSIDGITWVCSKEWKKGDHVFEVEKQVFPTQVPGYPATEEYKQLVVDSYGVMTEFVRTQDQMPHTREWEEMTKEYIDKYVNLLTHYTNNTTDENLLDALSVGLCFNVICFTPSFIHDITKPFLEWVNTVDPGWPLEDTKEVIQTNPPTEHPSFWNYIHHLTIRGLGETAASVLKSAYGNHLDTDVAECFDYAIQLFRSYPESDGTKYSFRQWRESCLTAKLKASEISTIEWRLEVQKMFEIMSGDVDAILSTSTTWYEAVGAMLKYREPKRSRLLEYYEQTTAALPPDYTVAWEAGCASILAGNYLQAIQKVESLDLCTAATLTQFCKQRGLLDRYVEISKQQQGQQGIAEWLLLQHAQQCLSTKDLTGIGVELLRDIGTYQAIQIIGEALPRLIGTDIDEIEWAVGVAAELGLEDTERSINKATARMFLSRQAHLDAFVAFERAGDVTGLSVHCWKLFEECLTTQHMPIDDITALAISENNDLELSPLIRECISPCAVLAGFIKNIQSATPSSAAKYIIALLQFPYLPPKYIGILIAMTIPLLSRDKPRIFRVPDLISIMTAVDSWENGDKDQFNSGMALLEHSLAIAPSGTSPYDWRSQFQVGVVGQRVVQTARIRLAKEMSRAYLEGA